ncbi:chondroadherin-like [Patiria miniata]|uniref:Uncharacterized protein n=1 Tax=Patiria miniata TaxID=46514 RepID=A0A913ZI81_PATMI|nr:chondroadherin-like [Patiria miniata]
MAFHCLIIITTASQVVSIVLLVCTISGVDASHDVGCNVTCEYTAWALDANCRDRGLTQVPHECSTSEMVDLRNNELTYLGAGSFAGYQLLQYLDLEFNFISNITRGAFDECISLKNIYLQFNSLIEVGERAFEGASDLKKLFLNQNSITYIHPDAFCGLDGLTGLYIGHNEITRLHASVFQHTPHLQYLHMGNNGLTEFPTGIFDTLTELVYINAENNNLKFLDGSLLKNLVNLEELNLSHNLILSITGFPILPNLTILDLFDNNLRDISVLADKINGLDELYLAENNNLTCTCSVDPIKKWVIDHMKNEDVETLRANVTCGWPQELRGYPLNRVTICPGPQIFGFVPAASVVPSTQITSVKSIVTTDYNLQAVKQNMKQNSQLDPVIIYIVVGVATFISVVVVLIVLIKYLDWRTHRTQQQQQATKQQRPTQQQQQQQQQSVPLVRIIPNRLVQDDDGAYEPVRIRPHSPSDSAFGSQDDVLAAQERDAQSWIDPTYRVAPYGSDDPQEVQHSYPPYMTMEHLNALHPTPLIDESFTSIEEPPPQQPNTNPFINDMPEDHVIFNASKMLRCSSQNPFQNNANTNPFINCA